MKIKLKIVDRRFGEYLIGISQSDFNEDDCVNVQPLVPKSKKNQHVYKLFKKIDKYVSFDEILEVLPQPKIVSKSNKLQYEFKNKKIQIVNMPKNVIVT